ncbi:nitrate/nitrite transporter NrtS [Phaeobacter sp. NW0010-22]|uniref:nitrate/nitrite transporter NrtS n=1 Tax=Phaeobacter sp. NW0010-22 TaxID=3135907 RepID=UPI003341BD79
MTQKPSNMPHLTTLMFGDGTPRKAFLTALGVGTLLTVINHGDVLLSGQAPPLHKVVLTYCVPYCVTTWGAVTGKRAQLARFEMRQR